MVGGRTAVDENSVAEEFGSVESEILRIAGDLGSYHRNARGVIDGRESAVHNAVLNDQGDFLTRTANELEDFVVGFIPDEIKTGEACVNLGRCIVHSVVVEP